MTLSTLPQPRHPKIEALRPKSKSLVKDLLDNLKICTKAWKHPDDRSKNSSWAYGTPHGPNLMFLWLWQLEMINGEVGYRHIAGNVPAKASGKSQSRRAQFSQNLDNLISGAYLNKKGIKVAIVLGKNDTDASKVIKRELDNAVWYPCSFDPNTSEYVVMRARAQPTSFDPSDDYFAPSTPDRAGESPTSNDDHAPQDETSTRTIVTYSRDPEIALKAKKRAGGTCEYCHKKTFMGVTGQPFLESHHVIPRAAGGPDVLWNVVALCPTDHARAHFSKDWRKVRSELIAQLGRIYPLNRRELEHLAREMDMRAQVPQDWQQEKMDEAS